MTKGVIHIPSKWQGGNGLFWRTSETYEIKEVELHGLNMLSFQLVLGTTIYYIIGCYILLTNLTTLMHTNEVVGMLKGLCPHFARRPEPQQNKHNNTIAKQVDAMRLINMSSHFCRLIGRKTQGQWAWQMRRG